MDPAVERAAGGTLFLSYCVTRPVPESYLNTHTHHPINQQVTMTAFCSTTCGQTYTQTLTARRRGCTPPTPNGAGGAMVPDGPTTFPTNYPGLRLGCVIDAADGQFCAVKMGAPQGGDCHFYKSCKCKFGSGRRVVCSLFSFRIRRRTSCMYVHQCPPYHHTMTRHTRRLLRGAGGAGGREWDRPGLLRGHRPHLPRCVCRIALLRYRNDGCL